LNVPDLSVIERIPDPKVVLFDVLREARGLTGRRLKRFNMAECRIRVTDLVSDFSPLRKLSAFKKLERDISKLKQNGWILETDGQTA
jgi:predicted RNA-binding protein